MSAHDDVALTSEERFKLTLMEEHDFIEDVMRQAAEEHAQKNTRPGGHPEI